MAIVSELEPGKAARIELEGAETARGVKASVSRMAKKMGKTVVLWEAHNAVYAELTDSPPRRRRGRGD